MIMRTIASQINRLAIVYSTIYSGADQRKYQSSASPAFVRGLHRWPLNSLQSDEFFAQRANHAENVIIIIHWYFYYSDVIMGTMASQITFVAIVYSTAHSGADQTKHQSSASLTFVRGLPRWTVNSPQSLVNSPHKDLMTSSWFG